MIPSRRRIPLAAALLPAAAALVALGVWQLERRVWKHALIEAVDARVHAAPVAAPLSAGPDDAYRRVRVTGRFRNDRETLVRAVTDLGGGYWVMTPLDTGHSTILVNRGFVPPEQRDPASRAASKPAGPVTITGLIRLAEPGGGFLHANDPAVDRWYSRDVGAIARARHLDRAAPYFIDADAALNAPGAPVGGLTVIEFPDNHLVYALTWFALAGLALWSAWRVLREGRWHDEDPA